MDAVKAGMMLAGLREDDPTETEKQKKKHFSLQSMEEEQQIPVDPLDVALAATRLENGRLHMPVISIPGCYFWRRESQKFCFRH